MIRAHFLNHEDRDRLTNFVQMGDQIVRIDAPGSTGPGVKDARYGRCLCFPKKHDFGPRVGFAYRPLGSNKTVIA